MSLWERLWFVNRIRRAGLFVDGRRRISEKRSFTHIAVLAPTGAGKSTAYIIPNLLRLPKSASAIVTDPSGELHERTAGALSKRGFDIKVIDVGGVNESLRFNPLHRAESATDIGKLAHVLISSAYPNPRGDRFWNDSAQALLSTLIRVVKSGPVAYQNLGNVRHLLNNIGSDGHGLDAVVSKYADDQTFEDYKGFAYSPEKVRMSVVSTARTALEPFADPDLRRLTNTDTIDFESLRKRPCVLYVIVPEHEMRYYRFFLALLYSQFFGFCMERPQKGAAYRPIYALLDEFGNAHIPDFPLYITTLRKRKTSISIILQSWSQLVGAYGATDAATILNGGCATKLYFPGLDHETCVELERMLGKQRTEARGRSRREPLLTADAIRTLPDNKAILISGNRKPVRLRIRPYYKSRTLRRLAAIPPPRIAPDANDELESDSFIPIPELPGCTTSDPNVQKDDKVDSPERFEPSNSPDMAEKIAANLAAPVSEQIATLTGSALRQAVLLGALDNDALVPMTEMMEALGISRDVADRLRKEKKLRPVVTKSGRNTKLYVTVGHVKNLSRNLEDAPPPARRRSAGKRRRSTET